MSETTVDHVSNLKREHFDMDDNYIHVDCYITNTCTDIFKVVYLIYFRFILCKNLQKIEKMWKNVGVIFKWFENYIKANNTEYIFCVLNILLCKSDSENSEKLDHCKIISNTIYKGNLQIYVFMFEWKYILKIKTLFDIVQYLT